MTDSFSVPRRSYDFEDYIDILRRNIAWLVAPAFAGLVIATVLAFFINREDLFVSWANMRVTPQQISSELYKTITTQDVADRINGMAQTVLSRTALEGMIRQYGLYTKMLKGAPMEDVIDKMRSNVGMRVSEGVVAGGRALPQLTLSFAYTDKYTAQVICQELVTRFMNASNNEISQANLSAGTFVKDEYNTSKQQLDAADKKLEDFRRANAGRLPEDAQMNVNQMNGLQNQMGQINDALNRINQQKMMLETQISMAKDRLSAVKSPSVVLHNDKVNQLNREIESLELNITEMKGRYTAGYPGLQNAEDHLAFLKKQRDTAVKEKVNEDSKTYDPATATADRMGVEETLAALNTQMKGLNMDAAQYRRDLSTVNKALATSQSRLQNTAGEKEYEDLIRDRDVAKNHYFESVNKMNLATASARIEDRKQGQALEQVDPAILPTAPSSPKRAIMLPIGIVGGLVLGLVIVAIREVKDTTLKTLKDARIYTQLSVLGSVPLLENDVVVQRRKQVMWVGWATATVAGLAIMALSLGRYYIHK